MAILTKTIKGKVYNLRIYSINVAQVQQMLDGKTFEQAIIDSNDDPVTNTIPFLFGILQKKDEVVDEQAAYDLYDELVDIGYTAPDFCSLIIEICEASGFFAPARVEGLRMTLKRIQDLQEEMLEKAKKKATEEN